jgi:Protein of unknown function (DUF3014)
MHVGYFRILPANIRGMAGIGDYEYQAPTENTLTSGGYGSGGGGGLRVVVIALLALVVVGAVAYYLLRGRTAPTTRPAETKAAAPAPKAVADDVEHIDLPPLDDSDALVRQRIGILSSNRLVAAWLNTKGLIRNFVVVIDNISHGMNPSRHLQVLKPAGQFRVTTRGSQVVIDGRNYERFAPIAAAAASIDAQSAGRLYRSFKPLLQTAYDELGNQESIDDGVARAIVDLLKVPAIDGDVRVEQAGEGIGYQYSDDRLESLNGAQKQLLRMGAKNIRIIQSQLRTFAMTIGIPASRLN